MKKLFARFHKTRKKDVTAIDHPDYFFTDYDIQLQNLSLLFNLFVPFGISAEEAYYAFTNTPIPTLRELMEEPKS